MGKDQASFSKSSKALPSKIRGGCGSIIPYLKGHYELSAEVGPIWCGMELRSMAGHYLICEECLATLD